MLLRPDKEAVIFKLKNPTRITTVIPTAKTIYHNELPFVAVPHRPDETKVLRNLGFKVPDPMPMVYDYPGPWKPFDAQVHTSSFLSMNDRAFVLNSMGTGKTQATLWSYDYLRRTKQAKRMLVVCPLSTMERTWADAVFNSFPHLSCVVLYGTRERRRKLLKEKADIYIINHDGVEILKGDLAGREDINIIALDEVALYRNAGTARWKAANEICNKQTPRRIWGLTGQPTPRAPTDAWAQCRLVIPSSTAVPKYMSKFRDMTMRQVSQFKWLPRDNAMEIVKDIMQPSIRFSLDECTDLPPETYIHRDVELTTEQKKAYDTMLRELHAEHKNQQIVAINESVKTMKLVQIALGVAYGEGGSEVILPSQHRINELRDLIESSEGKVLVFVPLTGALAEVARQLSDQWEVRVVEGATKKTERDEIFGTFQNTSAIDVLVANPYTMSHGLTLTAATTIVWFAPINSNDVFGQANARVRRPGQTRPTVIATIAATPVERKMYKRLQNQQAMQGLLLDMMEEQTQQEIAA